MTDVDIANLALGYLGDSATVTSLNPPEGSAQAQHCARFYPVALGSMLEDYDWNFITRRVVLAEVSAVSNSRWRYAYAMPSDAGSIITIIPAYRYSAFPQWGEWGLPFDFELSERESWNNFQIEVAANGTQVILTDVCDAVARYTTTQVSTVNFPMQFSNGLARLLASMLAGPIIKGEEGAAESAKQLQLAQPFINRAKVQDANQRHVTVQASPEWTRNR
jgi:hypothetical protein